MSRHTTPEFLFMYKDLNAIPTDVAQAFVDMNNTPHPQDGMGGQVPVTSQIPIDPETLPTVCCCGCNVFGCNCKDKLR